MPSAYNIYTATKFNLDLKILQIRKIPQQSTAFEEGEPKNSIQFVNENIYNGYSQYSVHFESKVHKSGKVFEKVFNYYLSPKDFNLYHNRTNSIVLICNNKNDSNEFVDLCNIKLKKDIKIGKLHFDLDTIANNIPNIKSAWFDSITLKTTSAAGVFGNKVEDSTLVQQIRANGGKLTYMMYDKVIRNENHTIGIGKDGLIVLYNRYELPQYELNVIDDFYEEFSSYFL
jgi:hypothetical protein